MEFVYLIGSLISLVILYFVVKNAVIAALASHYKSVRWYEATGEWEVGGGTPSRAPSELPVRQD